MVSYGLEQKDKKMKLLNTIRIFLWLKLCETWKFLLAGIYFILVVIGTILVTYKIYWKFGIIFYIFGLVLAGVFVIFINETIPWFKQNWKEAKRIAEEEKSIDLIKKHKDQLSEIKVDASAWNKGIIDFVEENKKVLQHIGKNKNLFPQISKITLDRIKKMEKLHKKAQKSKLVFKGGKK